MDRFAARKSINTSSLACHGAQPPSLKLFARRDSGALRHSDRGRLTVAVHGCWMSSEPAHMLVRTKICRLAGVETTPMRDVWQPGAALRAISRRLCSPAEVVRTPVQWQHGLSGRDRSLTRHNITVYVACVGDVLAIPSSVRHSFYTLHDGHRYATFPSSAELYLDDASCWRRNHASGTATVGGQCTAMVAESNACVHERHRVPARLQRRSEPFVPYFGPTTRGTNQYGTSIKPC